MLTTKFQFDVEVEGDKFVFCGPNSTTFPKAFQALDIVRSYILGKIKEAEEQQKAAQSAPQPVPEAPKEG